MHIVSCWGYLLCGMKQIVCLACTVYFGMQTNRYSLVSRIRNVWIIHPNFGHISNAWNVILTLVSVNSIAVYILRPYTFRIILKKHSVEPSFASLYRKHSVISPKSVLEADWPMGLMLDTLNWGLCMHRECGTCVTHVTCCMSGSLTRGGGENVPGIPSARATRDFTYLARDSLPINRIQYTYHRV